MVLFGSWARSFAGVTHIHPGAESGDRGCPLISQGTKISEIWAADEAGRQSLLWEVALVGYKFFSGPEAPQGWFLSLPITLHL